MIQSEENKKFSLVRRAQSITHAWRGLGVFIKTTHNAWIHISVFILVLVLGFVLGINKVEWLFVIFAGGIVFVAEAFNTAIEIDIDLTSPEYHPYARDTKDVAAGAVLLASIVAVVVGVLVFGPYLLRLI